jgi:hypothetical protein
MPISLQANLSLYPNRPFKRNLKMHAFGAFGAMVALVGNMAIASHIAGRHSTKEGQIHSTRCLYLSEHALAHIASVTPFCSSYLSAHKSTGTITVHR